MPSQNYTASTPSKTLALRISLVGTGLLLLALLIANRQVSDNPVTAQAGSLISAQLAHSATGYLVERDDLALQGLVNELVNSPLVAEAAILGPDQQTIVEANSEGLVSDRYSASVNLDQSTLGYVAIGLRSSAHAPLPVWVLWLTAGLFGFLQFTYLATRMQVFDHFFNRLAGKLAKLQSGAPPSRETDPLKVCEQMLGQLMDQLPDPKPPAAPSSACVLVALPGLDQWRKPLSDEACEKGLAAVANAIDGLAQQYHGEVEAGVNAYTLLVGHGDNVALRALGAARMLAQQLEGKAGLPPYAIALHSEAEGEKHGPYLRQLAWQQSCAQLLANLSPGAILLSRQALAQPEINQQVQVEQDDQHDYRITGFNPRLDQSLAEYLS